MSTANSYQLVSNADRIARIRVERYLPIGVINRKRRPAARTGRVMKSSDVIVDLVCHERARNACHFLLAKGAKITGRLSWPARWALSGL
jgi:hypothetical protein